MDTPGGPQQMVVINESGIYSLLPTSRKPEAKRFKKWVTGDVLSAIRRTGAYAAGPRLPGNFAEALRLAFAYGHAFPRKAMIIRSRPTPNERSIR